MNAFSVPFRILDSAAALLSRVRAVLVALTLLAAALLAVSPTPARASVSVYNGNPDTVLVVTVDYDYDFYDDCYGWNGWSDTWSFELDYGDGIAAYDWSWWGCDDDYWSEYYCCWVESETFTLIDAYESAWELHEDPQGEPQYSDWSPKCGDKWQDERYTPTRTVTQSYAIYETNIGGRYRFLRNETRTTTETGDEQNGCRPLNSVYNETVVEDWHDVGSGADCGFQWEDRGYWNVVPTERTRYVWWSNDRDGNLPGEYVTDSSSRLVWSDGCKPLNWRTEQEVLREYGRGDWSPECSTEWEDRTFTQTETVRKEMHSWRTNDRGDHTDDSYWNDDSGSASRTAQGCKSLTPHVTSTDVVTSWHEVSSSPTQAEKWEDEYFQQTYYEERTVRRIERNQRGDVVSDSTEDETRAGGTRWVWGTRPLNARFWKNVLARDWYDVGAWAPSESERYFWEDISQTVERRQDWEEWRINDRGDTWIHALYFVSGTSSRTVKGTKVPALSAVRVELPSGLGEIDVDLGGGSVKLPNGVVIQGNIGGSGKITIPSTVVSGGATVSTSGRTISVTTSNGTTTLPSGGSIDLGGGVVVSVTPSGNGSITLPGGAAVAVGSGGGSVSFPGGTSVRVSSTGRVNIGVPPGTPSVIAKAVQVGGMILNSGTGHAISVRDVITLIVGPLPSNPLLDQIDIGLSTAGIVQLGLRKGTDGPYEWLPVYVTNVDPNLAVDANRDATVAFDSSDATSDYVPYRFWINDDDDVDDEDPDDAENAPVSSADWLDDKLDGIRDLEDFARLKINLSGIADAVRQGQMRIALEWKGAPGYTGAPGIKLWRNLSPNGGTEYLSDVNVARQHLALREPGAIQGALRYVIPTQYWTDVGLSASQPYGNLLFEGTSAGKDQLVIKLLNADGAEIGEGGGVWLELKNIKSMYERVKATANGAEDLPFPYNYVGANSVPSPTMGWSPDPAGYAFEPAQGETQTYIVAVHGWNQTYERSVMYAETMFKRLWHRGYRGRFTGFRWPTFSHNVPPDLPSSYNDSEYRAWKCGVSLKQYLSSLPSVYTVNLVAHSMGNIVVGSALEKGASVANYALLNAAVPAICYDTSGTVVQTGWGYVTPNDDPDASTVALSYQGRLANVSANLINFFLPADSALFAWEINNDSPDGGRFPIVGVKPHQWPEGNPVTINAGYRYQRSGQAGQKLRVIRTTGERTLTSADEAMAFATQAPSLTVGADGRTRGAIDEWVDMSTYGFGSEHSAEFLFSIQQTREFYADLLLKLRVTTQP